MKILKFLFLLPLLAIGAQVLEPKIVTKPEPTIKNGLYYVNGKLYDGTLKMLRYSIEDLYDVNAMGMVYPRLKPLPPTLIREIDVQGGTAVRYRDYFDGRDKPSNEYPLKNDVRDGRYRRYYFDEGGVLKQEGVFMADKQEGVFTDYYVSGEVSARSPYAGGLRNGEDVDYYKSGKIRGVRTYKNDKREGAEKWYYESGAVEETGEYKNDRKNGVWKRFYENGKTRVVENYKDGEKDGVAREYYPSGKLRGEYEYKDGRQIGAGLDYYESGALAAKVKLKTGAITGCTRSITKTAR